MTDARGSAFTTTCAEDRSVDAGAAVTIRGLRRHFGPVRAVDGIDLTIAPGEVVALLGPNGAGKSTTIDLMLGLDRPDAGTVRIFGRTPRDAVAEGIVGAMLQSGGFLPDLTAGETVELMAALHTDPLTVADAMGQAGVTPFARRRVGKLSGGQKQRVRLAAALVANPDLLLLDEPTVAMDVAARAEFWTATRAYAATGRTVVFATHYLAEAEDAAHRVVLLRAGRVIADGSVAQVRAIAAGRLIEAEVPGADPAALRALPGVTRVEPLGQRFRLYCTDSDAALRALLAAHPGAHDLEVTARGLEEAFLTLTDGEQEVG
ncbi:MAG: ABC transporter ATP-binding protein [Actinomycetia bacterium]|nr:ABC transporter ATP-binding protein [Actinomycetes bacterium]